MTTGLVSTVDCVRLCYYVTVLNYSCEYSHIDCVCACSALWLQLCFGSHSHVCGFGLYVRAVYNCGFIRLGNCCHYRGRLH